MIESFYWKEELIRIAKDLERKRTPKRFSERRVCIIERDIMIGFFIVRRMIELYKVTQSIRNKRIILYNCPTTRHITHLNNISLDENYSWENEAEIVKDIKYLANQCIHACVSFVLRDETRNWSNLIVVSDFDKQKYIWRIPIETIRLIFLDVAKDYPSSFIMSFNKQKNDYDITTD